MNVRAAHVSMVVSARIESMASAAPAHQDSVGPRVSWMWMNVQALLAGTVPSVWTSLTAMSVAVQRVRLHRETVARAGRWAGGPTGVKDQ